MQQPQHHHHHKPKPALSGTGSLSWIRRSPPPSPPHKKPWGAGAGGSRGRYACRLVPLLVLTLYSLFTVLRIPSSSLVVNTADSERVERRDDVEAFKTHLPSNQNGLQARQETRSPASLPCSAFISGEAGGGGESSSSEEGVLCCDRSHYRSDVCYLRGDARTDPSTSSILLYDAPRGAAPEKVRPYTRKFEESIMRTIDEVTILPVASDHSANGTSSSTNSRDSLRRRCDVRHPPGVAAVVFSTGGYTGNVYHEFSDGLIPLFVTSQRFRGEVVFVVLEYHYWWLGRYGAILERLTNYKIVDFRYDRRVHCFDEMIVGLRIHGELVVDPKLMPNGKGLQDFQALLHQGYSGGKPTSSSSSAPAALPLGLPSRPCDHAAAKAAKPKMLIFIRKQNRVILNLPHVVTACRRAGFAPHVMNLRRQTPLPVIHAALASADAMVAVHGAAVTHFLFMRPGTVLLQIVPVGLDWAAESFYGKPAQELGLKYMEYKVAPEESSLAAEYGVNSTVVRDPSVISSQGWWEMKKVYMDRQNVTVGVKRFGELLRTARLHLRNATACGKAASLR